MDLKHFNLKEFNCTHTGKNEMNEVFLQRLDELREVCGIPFKITSGYRDKSHPAEVNKEKGGTHTKGIAADIYAPDGISKRTIIKYALDLGFRGIGVGKEFIHLDVRESYPVVWGY